MSTAHEEWDKATAKRDEAAQKLELLHDERERIAASPGKPFKKDASLETRIDAAQEKLDGLNKQVKDHEATIEGITAEYEKGVNTTPGWFSGAPDSSPHFAPGAARGSSPISGTESPASKMTREQMMAAYRGGKVTDPDTGDTVKTKGYEPTLAAQRAGQSKLGDIERERQQGQQEQLQANEDARKKEIMGVNEKEASAQAQQQEATAGVEAAARRIQQLQTGQPGQSGQPGQLGPQGGVPGQPGAGPMHPSPRTGYPSRPMAGAGGPNLLNMIGGLLSGGKGGGGGGGPRPGAGPMLGAMPVGGAMPGGGLPPTIRPAAGGSVPITNSVYDPRTGQFTGQTGADWFRQNQGGMAPMTASPSCGASTGCPRRGRGG